MRVDWNVYNKRLIFTFLSILFFLAVFNILVDPFSVFNTAKIPYFNEIKPDKDRNQRITKIVALKMEKRPINAVFLGSSRVNSSISEEYYLDKTTTIAKNLGMNALSHDETFKVARYVVDIHPEIKTIFIGLDFFRFLEKNKDNKRDVPLSTNKNLTIAEFNPLILSFNTTIASFNTLTGNLMHTKSTENPDKVGLFKKKLKQYVFNYENAVLSESEIQKLHLFNEEMKAKGHNVVFYLNPTHVLDICLIDKMGYLPLFFEWKKKIAQRFEYTDFVFVNDLTSEQIDENTKYFLESSHASLLMGNVIIDRLLSNNNKYGLQVSKDNVDFYNKQNLISLKQWQKKNKSWVSEVESAINEDNK